MAFEHHGTHGLTSLYNFHGEMADRFNFLKCIVLGHAVSGEAGSDRYRINEEIA